MVAILELHLENVKSIVSGRAKFTEGVNFIHGPNGAGKSSILDALAFALYGTDWLKRVRLRLSDLVRVHTRTAIFRVKVRGIDGKIYIIQRAITPEKTIEGSTYVATEDGKRLATRDREVTQYVEKILGVPLSVFCELLYIRQGELRDILETSRRTETKLDRVLKIETLDKLRNDYLREARKQLETHIRRLEGKLTYLNQELSKRKKELEELSKERENSHKRLEELSLKLSEVENRKKEVEKKLESYKSVETRIRELETLISVKLKEINDISKRISELENIVSRKEEYEKKVRELEKVEKDLQRLQKEKENLLELKSRLESELESVRSSQQTLDKIYRIRDSLIRELEHVQREINELKTLERELKKLEDELKILEVKREKLEKYREKLSQYIAIAQRLEEELNLLSQAEGVCPLCMRELPREKAQEIMEKKRRELEQTYLKIEKLKQLIRKYEKQISKLDEVKERYYTIKERLSRAGELESRRVEIEQRLKEVENEISRIEDIIRSKEKLSAKLSKIQERLSTIETLINSYLKALEEKDRLLQKLTEIRQAETELAELRKRLSDINNELETLQKEYSRLSLEYSRVKEVEEEYSKICEVETTLRDEISQLSGRLRAIDAQIEKVRTDIENKINEKKSIEEEISKYVSAYRFVSKLMDVIEKVKPVVRKIFIELLNQELNYMFLEVCHKSAFVSIRVTEDYEIYVKRRDGVELSVDALSVGEKNLVALLFRYALAKVVLGHIPFLILDEPTEHLDDEHRRRIAQWLKDISTDVDMIIITSQVDAFETVADNIIRVEFINEKGESTFRNIEHTSSIESTLREIWSSNSRV